MLRKLMKHELRATGRIMLPLFLLVLVTAVGGNIATKKLVDSDYGLVEAVGVILLLAFAVAIAAVCIVSFFLMIQRFYKNLLQDEGYVMMTLPVSVHQHIWSKILVSLIWFVATFLVVLAAVLILVFEIEYVEQIFAGFSQFWQATLEIFSREGIIHVAIFALEFIALFFASTVLSCLQFYAPMAIGQSFAKNKVLMSVVVYFATGFVMQIFSGIVAAAAEAAGISQAMAAHFSSYTGLASNHIILLGFVLFTALLAGVFYAVTAYFLKKHLNLE